MDVGNKLAIRPFRVSDQEAAKELVLAGLGERWGWIDRTLNPDLNDIAATYVEGLFLVGYLNNQLVATGALIPEISAEGIGAVRVVRMSVRRDLRGQGIGRRLLDALMDDARRQGYTLVLAETTSTWTDAVRFYLRYGFQVVEEREEGTHMQLELEHGLGSDR